MGIYDKLYEWQKRVVDKFKERNSFGLFLDMGLGKTPTSLAFTEVNNCTKVIIITINKKAEETIDENGSFLNWINQSNINYNVHTKSSKNDKFDTKNNDLLIINYESLFSRNKNKKEKVQLKEIVVDFINSCKNHNVAIVIDESHKMKNLQSMQTLAIMKIKQSLKLIANNVYSYLLTGTPFTTGYIDLYAQLKFLGYNETKATFLDNFCVRDNRPGLLGWQQPIIGYKNLDELYKLIHKFAITIKSEDVVDLPEQVFQYHTLPQNLEFELFTNEKISGNKIIIENNFRTNKIENTDKYLTNSRVNNPYYRNIAYPDLTWLAETSGAFWLRARQLSIGFQGNSEKSIWFDRTRLNKLKDFLSQNEDNYLLFYNYTPELLEIYAICEELGYNIDVCSGEIKSMHFYNKYHNLSEEQKLLSKKNIILANFASGSTGLNWQDYNKCIIFSLPLYKDWEQGLKRIHRLGQKETVVYHVFYQKNWLDYGMKSALEECKDYSKEMFESDLKRVNALMN